MEDDRISHSSTQGLLQEEKKAGQPLPWSELIGPEANDVVQIFTKDLENERNGEVAEFCSNT